ncbi:MAG: CBS domain-containing protein [Proteobacteria bacterium]|nr:CBS domain-containing protein [Pseudomonadota bacterium]
MNTPRELILTHVRADFDGFASMLLANRLYPEAVPVLPSTTIYRLREVLSLYRNVADFQSIRALRKWKGPAPGCITVVDTKKRGQLVEFDAWLQQAESIRIYDHHPPTTDDLALGHVEQYPYGANSTGLYFQATRNGLELSQQEATIVLLGIYADTGNLTYPGTTADDALAASELLRLGADLQVVNHYLRPYLDPAQRLILRDMLITFREFDMEGYKVVLVKQLLEKPLQGISDLLAQISDMAGADAILGVFATRAKPGVQIIIQSLVPEINAGELTGHFDGGGHAGAAAAFLPQANIDGVAETLLTLLTEVPLPMIKVKDVMATELLTVQPNRPLSEIEMLLSDGGVHGAPVVDEEGRLVGVISLRDVEKARLSNLLHAPVSAFMSANRLLTIGPDTPLITARKIISSNDIGRLPVVDDCRLIGIISRSDILNFMNHRSDPPGNLV